MLVKTMGPGVMETAVVWTWDSTGRKWILMKALEERGELVEEAVKCLQAGRRDIQSDFWARVADHEFTPV
jgi:hypothetical protein